MEVAEDDSARNKKKMKVMDQVHMEIVAQHQDTIRAQNAANDMLRRANIRGAAQVMRKHEAGMRLMTCLGDLFNDVDLSYGAKDPADRRATDEYLMHMKERILRRSETAFALLIHEHDELEAIEEIDLTGDETEEETDGEEEIEI